MTYPEPDFTGVEAAREKYAVAITAKESTMAKVVTAKAAALEAKTARTRLIRQAAAGEIVSAAQHAEAEAGEREAAAGVKRHELVLEAQEAAVRAAESGITKAQGFAHHNRLIAAVAERAAAAASRAAAFATMREAEARMKAAHEVAMQAFGVGHPMPAAVPVGAFHTAAELEAAVWGDSSQGAIKAIWRDLAAEAMNQPA